MALKTIVLAEPPTPPGWVGWPIGLPTCAESWGEQSVDPRIRTDMDVGRPKTRRRYTGIMRKISLTLNLGNWEIIQDPLYPTDPKKTITQCKDLINLRDFFESPGDVANHNGGTDGGYHFFKFTSPTDGRVHFYRFLSPPQISNTGAMSFSAKMEWEEL